MITETSKFFPITSRGRSRLSTSRLSSSGNRPGYEFLPPVTKLFIEFEQSVRLAVSVLENLCQRTAASE